MAPMVDMIKEEIFDDMLPLVDDNAISGESNSIPVGKDNHSPEDNDDLCNIQDAHGMKNNSRIIINECNSNPLDSMMEENLSASLQKPAIKYFRKRKGRRRLLTIRKCDRRRRLERAMSRVRIFFFFFLNL